MKRFICALLVLVLMLSVASLNCFGAQSVKYGDTDKDGVVSITDATSIQMHLAGMETLDLYSQRNANVDGDKVISVMDSTCIQLYLAMFITDFPSNVQKPSEPSFDDDGYNNQIVRP